MPRTVTFRQADLTRAVRAAQAAGLAVTGAEVTREGTIRVLTAAAAQTQPDALAEWRSRRDARKAQGA